MKSTIPHTRKPRAFTESTLQQAAVKWFRYKYPKLKKLLISIPNEGKRSRANASRMKSQGLVSGAPDLILLRPHYGNYEGDTIYGLCIEMKSEKGIQSDSQVAFQVAVTEHNYQYSICRSFDEFEKLITDYLK